MLQWRGRGQGQGKVIGSSTLPPAPRPVVTNEWKPISIMTRNLAPVAL
jgi:hypothetical protein